MAIAFVNSISASGASASSLTFAITVAAGDNLCLVVGVGAVDGTTGDRDVSGITANGDALSQGIQSDDTAEFENCEIWYLLNPDVGTYNIVVTFGGSCQAVSAAAAVYSGVLQTSQPDVVDAEDDASAITGSATIVTTVDGVMLVSNIIRHNATGTINSVGTDQNIRENDVIGAVYQQALYDRLTTTAGSYDMTATFSANSSSNQAAIGLKPAEEGGGEGGGSAPVAWVTT